MEEIIGYLVVKVKVQVDLTKTDQQIAAHKANILQEVMQELDYTVTFDRKVESGDSSDNAIEVPVKITDTEVVGMLDTDPT